MITRRVSLLACAVERSSFALAIVCLGAALLALLQGIRYQAAARAGLSSARAAETTADPLAGGEAPLTLPEGFVGELVIPRLRFSVAVIDGEDARALRLGIGHLRDTPLPWQGGNTALAAHRDTFFRPLANVRAGDAIQLQTTHGTFDYIVTRTLVVHPQDVWVVGQHTGVSLTLITCYPFSLVGPAPDRWVVQAVSVESSAAAGNRPRSGRVDEQATGDSQAAALARELQ
jgi:sortase A